MSQQEENDDLYGDLNTINVQANENKPQSNQVGVKQIHTIHTIKPTSGEDMKKLQSQLEKMRKENETLKRNIGTLYRTAKMELERKDARILILEGSMKRMGEG